MLDTIIALCVAAFVTAAVGGLTAYFVFKNNGLKKFH